MGWTQEQSPQLRTPQLISTGADRCGQDGFLNKYNLNVKMFKNEDNDDVLTPLLEVWQVKMEFSRMLVRKGAR